MPKLPDQSLIPELTYRPWLTSTRGSRGPAMSKCHLTVKDSFVMKALLDDPGLSDDIRTIVQEKLRSASLAPDHTTDRRVAYLGSRVRFAVGETSQERVLSANPDSTVGLELSLASLTGAVLIGMEEGQIAHIKQKHSHEARIELLKVLSEPATQHGGGRDADVVYMDFTRRSLGSKRFAPYDDGPGAA